MKVLMVRMDDFGFPHLATLIVEDTELVATIDAITKGVNGCVELDFEEDAPKSIAETIEHIKSIFGDDEDDGA